MTPTGAAGDTGRQQEQADRTLPGSFPLGRWRGVEVYAHWSLLLTVVLFAAALATGTLPDAHPGDTRTAYWLAAVATSLVFFLSLLAHELAHALVARGYGIEVKRITLWMLGGFTQLGGPSPTARADGLVALAGPATSLGIGLVSGALALAVGTSGLLGSALLWLAWVSVVLAVFNLLPGAPLDGGRVLRAMLWSHYDDRDRAALVAARTGKMLGWVLIGVGLLNAFAGLAAGLWLALVGWFILGGATAEQAAARDEHLAGVTAAEVMSPDPVVAPVWWTVDQMVAHLSPARITSGVFPVADLDGRTIGVVTLADLDAVPPTHRADTRLEALAVHHAAPVIVTPDADAAEVAAQIRPQGGTAVVEEAGRTVGVITELELGHAAHLSLLGWHTVPGGRPS
jgi:Zn-dependent protease